MLPSLAPQLHHRPDFLAGVLGVVVVKDILEHRKVVFPLGAVHVVVDGDEAHVVGGEDEILQAAHAGILPAQPGQVLDDQRGHAVVLHMLHHLQEAGAVEVGAAVPVVNEKDSVLEAVVGGVLGQQGLLRRDLSRVFSPKSNNNYNVTESTTAMRRFPFRFYCVHIIFAFVFLAIIVNLLKVCYNTFVGSVG